MLINFVLSFKVQIDEYSYLQVYGCWVRVVIDLELIKSLAEISQLSYELQVFISQWLLGDDKH